MAIDDFKAYANVFRQSIEEVKAYLAKNGRTFDPSRKHPAYTGFLNVPVEAVPDLIDYLTKAAPVYDRNGQNPSIKLSVKGWIKQPEGKQAFQSFNIEPDYKTAQGILSGGGQRSAAPQSAPAYDDFDSDIPF